MARPMASTRAMMLSAMAAFECSKPRARMPRCSSEASANSAISATRKPRSRLEAGAMDSGLSPFARNRGMSPLTRADRDEDLRAGALDQQRRGVPALELGRLVAQVLDVLHAAVVHGQDDIAGLDARARRRTLHVRDHDTAFGFHLVLLLRRQGPHHEAQLG